MKKKLIVVFITLVVLLFIVYKFVYKEHRDISSEDASFTLTSSQLKQEFALSGSLANSKYADKTIQVEGKVTAVDRTNNSIMVDGNLSAVLKEPVTSEIRINKEIKLKGRFVGYDDLLEELKMDQVSIIK